MGTAPRARPRPARRASRAPRPPPGRRPRAPPERSASRAASGPPSARAPSALLLLEPQRGRLRRGGPPCAGRRAVLVAVDDERHAHERAPLVEVLAAQALRDDVDAGDVADGPARLVERLAHGVVGARRRAADDVDRLRGGHGLTLTRGGLLEWSCP